MLEKRPPSGFGERGIPDQRYRQRADGADAQPEHYKVAENMSFHRRTRDAADRIRPRAGAAGADQRDLLQGNAGLGSMESPKGPKTLR